MKTAVEENKGNFSPEKVIQKKGIKLTEGI